MGKQIFWFIQKKVKNEEKKKAKLVGQIENK